MTILKKLLAEAAMLCPKCKEVLDTGPGEDDVVVGPDGKAKCEKCGATFELGCQDRPSGMIRGAGMEMRIKEPEILMIIDRRLRK